MEFFRTDYNIYRHFHDTLISHLRRQHLLYNTIKENIKLTLATNLCGKNRKAFVRNQVCLSASGLSQPRMFENVCILLLLFIDYLLFFPSTLPWSSSCFLRSVISDTCHRSPRFFSQYVSVILLNAQRFFNIYYSN